MGLEGAASRVYFSCLSGLVPPEGAFDGHSRRPPKDLANAALSYAYAILLAECTGALLAAGLEPSLGVLHASTDKRPSLSLDLYAAGPPGGRAGGLGLPAAGVRLPAAAGARRARRGAPAGHRDHQPGRRRHPPLPAMRLLPSAQRGPRDLAARSTTPGCTEGYGEPAARRERAAHRRIPSRLRRRPCFARRSVPPAAVTSLAMVTALTPFAMLPPTIAVARISISFRMMNTQRLSRLFPKQISW